MAETAREPPAELTRTALGRPSECGPGSAPVPTPELGFYRRARERFEPKASRAIIQTGKDSGARRRWGGGMSPTGCVFSEMNLGHQSVEHGPKASFDGDAPVRA
jgi:hypothetical protein